MTSIQKLRNSITSAFAVLLTFSVMLSGCASTPETAHSSEATESEAVPSLQLTYKADQKSFATFEEEELNGAFQGNLSYFQVSDVMITLGDTAIALEDALRDGTVTFHEIHYLARKDAAAGICYEAAESKRGLTRFSYDYLSYKLYITDDIYETPDGKQHHIRKILVTTTGNDPVSLYPELDQEDWGITFEIAGAAPSGILLNYTQSGGQLIGQLRTGNYDLTRTDTGKVVPHLDYMQLPESQWIEHNAEGSIMLDFEQQFGMLVSGDYLLYLYLHDDYDPEQIPPLIRNYHDIQCYTVEFTIP